MRELRPGGFERGASRHRVPRRSGALHAELKKPSAAASTRRSRDDAPMQRKWSTKRSCAPRARRRLTAPMTAHDRAATTTRSKRATRRARGRAAGRAAGAGRAAQATRRPSPTLLRGVDAGGDHDRARRSRALPVTRKHDCSSARRRARAGDPFGGFAAIGWRARGAQRARVFASPGPIYEPEGARADYWRMARALYAAGFRAGDLVHNSFTYHLTPAGAMMESGAHALGCTVFPAGTGQHRAAAAGDRRPAAATATSARRASCKILLEKADERASRLPSLKQGAGRRRGLPAALRDWLAERGIAAYQCYATADLGLIAYETAAREGLVRRRGRDRRDRAPRHRRPGRPTAKSARWS